MLRLPPAAIAGQFQVERASASSHTNIATCRTRACESADRRRFRAISANVRRRTQLACEFDQRAPVVVAVFVEVVAVELLLNPVANRWNTNAAIRISATSAVPFTSLVRLTAKIMP